MKYEIDTIPVWDAVRAGSECPFCLLEKRSRQAAVRYYLGPSVMVPEVRVSVNETGFRPENWRLLAKDANKLGLGLIGHTRLKALHGKLAEKSQALRTEAAKAAAKNPLEALTGHKALDDQIAKFTAFLRDEETRCLIENKVSEDLNRYAYTLVHLWNKDKDFRPAWNAGAGTCLRHAPLVLEMARDQLSASPLGTFVGEYWDLLSRNLSRVEDDLLAFTQTFDSTRSHEIKGNPQGAVDRGLQKMAGVFPEYEDESKARRGPLMGGVTST